jgi:DNA-binding transcriptional LysR family regulator
MMPRKHRLARRASVSLRELAQEPMALTPENHSVRRLFDIACGRAGVTVEPVFVSNQSAALFAFAAGGNGITLASPFAAHYPDVAGRVTLVPIKSPTLDQRYYQVQTMAGRRLPEAVSAFAEHLVKIIDGLR